MIRRAAALAWLVATSAAGARLAVAVPVLAAALLPGPAGAQGLPIPSVEADSAVLLSCLGSGKSADLCVGAMTLDCLAENDIGNENLEERLCVVEELVVWRDLVGRAGDRLGQRLAAIPASDHPVLPGDPAELGRAAAATWRQWAESQCRLERAAAGRSGRRAIVEDTCLRDLTAARYGGLQRLIARLGGN